MDRVSLGTRPIGQQRPLAAARPSATPSAESLARAMGALDRTRNAAAPPAAADANAPRPAASRATISARAASVPSAPSPKSAPSARLPAQVQAQAQAQAQVQAQARAKALIAGVAPGSTAAPSPALAPIQRSPSPAGNFPLHQRPEDTNAAATSIRVGVLLGQQLDVVA